jgi:hypothetical protein
MILDCVVNQNEKIITLTNIDDSVQNHSWKFNPLAVDDFKRPLTL